MLPHANAANPRTQSHDDITYQSIAKAFGLPLKLHQATLDKMKQMSRPRKGEPPFDWDTDSPALKAKLRMVELPTDEKRDLDDQFIFPYEDMWVPVSVVNGNIHILPGIPSLCEYSPARRVEQLMGGFGISIPEPG